MVEIGFLNAKFQADVGDFIKDVGKAGLALQRLEKDVKAAINGINASLGAIGVGISVGAVFKRMIDEAGQAEAAQKKVEAILRSTGGVAGVTAKQVDDLATAYSNLTGIDDDVIKGGEALLLTFKSIGKDIFPQATEAMLDMSETMGQDLKSSAVQLGKALNDPKNGLTALQRIGVSFTESQKALIKSFVDTGQTVKAQKIILQEIQEEMGGTAAAARDTLGGAFKALDTAVGNFFERLGTDNGTLGGFRNAVELMTAAVEQFTDDLPAIVKQLEAWEQQLQATAGTIINAIKPAINWTIGAFFYMQEAIREVGEDWNWLVDGAQKTAKAIGDTFGALMKYVQPVLNFFNQGKGLAGALQDGLSKIAGPDALKGSVDPAKFFNKDYFDDALAGPKKAWDDFYNGVQQKVQKIHEAGSKTRTGLKAISQDAAAADQKSVDKLKELLNGLDLEIKKKQGALSMDKDAVLHAEAQEKVAKLFEKDLGAQAAAASKVYEKLKQISTLEDEGKRNDLVKKLQAELDQKTAILENDKQRLLLLEAQAKIEGLFPFDEQKRAEALDRVKKTLQEISDAESSKKRDDLLKSLNDEYEKKKALDDIDGQRIIHLEAQEKVEELFPYSEQKRADALAKVEEQLRKIHTLESEQEWQKKLQAAKDETAALDAKLHGTEKQFEAEKRIRDLEKDPYLSPQRKLDLAAAISKEADAQDALNKKIEAGKKVLAEIDDSSIKYKQKLDDLDKAYQDQIITLDQYNDALDKLNKKTLTGVQKSVHDFTHNLVDGMANAITSGQKLSDVFKNMGIQLAKMGVQKFLVDPLANAAGNYAKNFFQNNVLPGAGGVNQTGGGALASWLRKWFANPAAGPGAPATAAAAGSQTPVATTGNTPAASLGSLAGLSPLPSPIAGTTTGSAATAFYDAIQNINTTLNGVKATTEEGEAIRVRIVWPKATAADNAAAAKAQQEDKGGSTQDQDNIIPFLRRFEGRAGGAPAWRVFEPDCPCPGGMTSKTGGAGTPGGTSSSKSSSDGGFQWFQPDTVLGPFFGSLWGNILGKIGDKFKLTPLETLASQIQQNTLESKTILQNIYDKIASAVLPGTAPNQPAAGQPSTWVMETLLRYVIDFQKKAIRVTNPDCPCGPESAAGNGGSGKGGGAGRGYLPPLPGIYDNSLGPLLKGAANAVSNLGGGFGAGGFGPGGLLGMIPSYGAFGGGNSLQGVADQFNASGGYSAVGTVSGSLLPYAGAPNSLATAQANAIAAATQPGTNGKGYNPYTQAAGGGTALGWGSPNQYLSTQQTNQYLNGLQQQNNRQLQSWINNGQISSQQALNIQGAWTNAINTQAAQGYRATPNWLEGKNGGGFNFGGGGALPVQVNELGGSVGAGVGGYVSSPNNGHSFSGNGSGAWGRNVSGSVLDGLWEANGYQTFGTGAGPGIWEAMDHSVVTGSVNGVPMGSNIARFVPSLDEEIPGYADGGFPEVGKPSYVGEQGKELFVPSQPGQVVSNAKLRAIAGDSAPIVNIHNNGHPINVTSQEWDGRALKLGIDSVVASAPHSREYQRSAKRATKPRRTG